MFFLNDGLEALGLRAVKKGAGKWLRKKARDPVLVALCGATLYGMVQIADEYAPAGLEVVATDRQGQGASCRLTRVVDGDTVTLTCEGRKINARLVGFDAPELSKPQCNRERIAAEAAKAALARHIGEAGHVAIIRKGNDRYGRELVVLRVDGRDVADLMISAGHARAYGGEKRKGWCG